MKDSGATLVEEIHKIVDHFPSALVRLSLMSKGEKVYIRIQVLREWDIDEAVAKMAAAREERLDENAREGKGKHTIRLIRRR